MEHNTLKSLSRHEVCVASNRPSRHALSYFSPCVFGFVAVLSSRLCTSWLLIEPVFGSPAEFSVRNGKMKKLFSTSFQVLYLVRAIMTWYTPTVPVLYGLRVSILYHHWDQYLVLTKSYYHRRSLPCLWTRFCDLSIAQKCVWHVELPFTTCPGTFTARWRGHRSEVLEYCRHSCSQSGTRHECLSLVGFSIVDFHPSSKQ